LLRGFGVGTFAELERLRKHVTTTAARATDLMDGLKALDDELIVLLPSLGRLTDAEREAYVAQLCGFDAALAERLRELIEALADVLAGLTSGDGGQLWLQHRISRLEAGEETAA
jgi:hypothetical protein